MMKHIRPLTLSARAAFVLAAFVATMIPCRAQAQAVLNPGYINGTIAVTGETINQATISASWTDDATGDHYAASTSLNGGGNYSLTVNVPSGVTPEYTVSVTVQLNGAQSFLFFPVQYAVVTAFNTTVADFVVDPGYISATVTPTSGSVNSVAFTVFGGDGSASQSGGPGASRTFPVVPSDSVLVFGSAAFNTGSVSLGRQTISVSAGATVPVSWTATPPVPPGLGTLSGTFTFNGAAPDRTDIRTSCGGGTKSLTGNGNFSFPNLVSGGCALSTYSHFNNGYLYLPDSSYSPGRNLTITTGATTTVDIATTAAFLTGTIELTGTTSLAQASTVSLTAYGAGSTLAAGGSAGTSPSPQTGDYSLVLTPGGWSPVTLGLYFENADPAAYLQEYLTFFDTQAYYDPIALSAGQTVTKNLSYGTGKVTLNFRVAGGGTLSFPSVYGTCFQYDQNNQETSSYLFSSYGNQTDVTLGRVTFVGMAGTCTIDAYADVGESNTRFGGLTVEVVRGTEVEIDLDGPSLTVTFPPADHITSDAVITVTGFASDDVAITTVTVNGTPATLTPVGPATPVSFSFPLALNLGPNQIVTVATDSDGLTASDTRTVYRVQGPANTPPVVSLTGPDHVLSGSTSSYSFMVTDPDAGATFTVTAVSCGANGNQVGATTTTPAGGSFQCAFSGEATSTVSVQVTDNNGAPSNVATLLVTVAKAPTTTVVTCPSSVAYTGEAQTPCTATVTGADGLNQTVPVTYTANVTVGTATASAVYPGDLDHNGSDDSKTFAIDPIGSTTVVSCPASVDYTGAAQAPCTATVTSAAGLSQSLTVTYADNINSGSATASAEYGGDANHTGSDDSATFAINPIASSTVVSCPASVDYTGAAQTPCSATVTSADGLDQSLTVTYGNNVNAGTATASAAYAGDANHAASDDSATFAINPNSTIPTTTTVEAPTITYAADGSVTVAVHAASGTVAGHVSLRVDGGAAQTKTLVGGSATFTVVRPNAGNHALSATFAEQGNFGASNATGTLIVNQSPTATTLTSSPNPSSQGQLVTLTATVTAVAPGSGVPVGTVTFKDGTTVLGTVAVNASGRAVLTTSSLALGPHPLTAAYSGNANYKPSSASTSHLVFAYASGGGTFAIGDLNSAVGTQVTFWGAQWWKRNSLSGVVYAPAAFKGYITTPIPAPPVVGGTWRTDPGNSSNPPATVPAYLAVVVTSSTTKSGSLITGNVVGLAIVRTDAGYAGSPGHIGTGTIVAVIY